MRALFLVLSWDYYSQEKVPRSQPVPRSYGDPPGQEDFPCSVPRSSAMPGDDEFLCKAELCLCSVWWVPMGCTIFLSSLPLPPGTALTPHRLCTATHELRVKCCQGFSTLWKHRASPANTDLWLLLHNTQPAPKKERWHLVPRAGCIPASAGAPSRPHPRIPGRREATSRHGANPWGSVPTLRASAPPKSPSRRLAHGFSPCGASRRGLRWELPLSFAP